MSKTFKRFTGMCLLVCMILFSLIGCQPAEDTTSTGNSSHATVTTGDLASGDGKTTDTSVSVDSSGNISATDGQSSDNVTTTVGGGAATTIGKNNGTTTGKAVTTTTTQNTVVVPVSPKVERTYSGAHGLTMDYASNQKAADFNNHCAALEKNGYQLYTSNSIGENRYATYRKNGQYLHTYFTAYAGEIRTVKDSFSKVQFATKAQSYTKVTDTAVVQLIHNYDDGSWGMGYLIVLEDGRFVVIDGGLKGNGTNANRLYNLMKQLNKRADGKIVIAAWMFTHDHGDHEEVFRDFAVRHSGKVTLEQVIFNTQGERGAGGADYLMTDAFLNDVKKFGSNIPLWAPQVGQVFYLANARFEVLHTVYSMFPYEYAGNVNDTSMVLRMETAGQKVMWPGDIEKPASGVLCSSFGDYLKSDILQMPHHGCEAPASQDFYKAVWPKVMFWDTAQFNIRLWTNKVPENRYALTKMEVEEYHVADDKSKMMVLPYKPGNIVELEVSATVE